MITTKAGKASFFLCLLVAFASALSAQVKLPLSRKQAKSFRAAYPKIAKRAEVGLEEVVVLENPFFKRHTLFVVQHYAPRTAFFASFAVNRKGEIQRFLQTTAEFQSFVTSENIGIQNKDEAIAFAQLLRRAHHSPCLSCYIVENIEDVRFEENLDGERDATKRAFESKYRHVIQPMTAVQAEGHFLVSYYQMMSNKLEKVMVKVRPDGKFEKLIEVLERGLPVPFR